MNSLYFKHFLCNVQLTRTNENTSRYGNIMSLSLEQKICKGKGKAVPVLNQVPCHEDVGRSGGTVPGILNLGVR
jgi:hypothetical protein